MVTNLFAGWIAARVGMVSTLYAGLGLQVLALLALAFLDPGWTMALSVAYVMLVQGVSGVAKDLAKMSSKSAVKILAPETQGGLFRWVAVLTGSKNAIKGIGFLLGAVLLGLLGFTTTVLAMAAVLAVILAAILVAMPSSLPAGRKGVKFSEVFSKSANVNWLSAARVFLFGARDVWFVVGIPIYFYAVLSDGSEASNRTAFFAIGTFMAGWIILYDGGVDHPLRCGPSPRPAPSACCNSARAGAGGPGTGLGVGAQRHSCRAHTGHSGAAAPGVWDHRRAGNRVTGLWGRVRGQFIAALLPHPCVLQVRARDHGRGFLLHGKRRWATAGHGAFGAVLPSGWLAAYVWNGNGHGGALGAGCEPLDCARTQRFSQSLIPPATCALDRQRASEGAVWTGQSSLWASDASLRRL